MPKLLTIRLMTTNFETDVGGHNKAADKKTLSALALKSRRKCVTKKKTVTFKSQTFYFVISAAKG